MAEYAPQAIKDVYTKIKARIPSAVLSGVLGDAAHTYGYHRARNKLPGNDYSVVLKRDKGGDGEAAAALDVSLSPILMRTVTARLIAAAKAKDPRMSAVRELCGTTDGKVTHNYDIPAQHEGYGEWDDSHLWHVHLSFYRDSVNDVKAMQGVADVMAGRPRFATIKVALRMLKVKTAGVAAGGVTLNLGDEFASPDGSHKFVMQGDGNAVLYHGAKATWQTGTAGKGGQRFVMQTDGNAVVYGENFKVLWTSRTNNQPGASLHVQDDGNLVIYKARGGVAWQSKTNGK